MKALSIDPKMCNFTKLWLRANRRRHYAGKTVKVLWCAKNSSFEPKMKTFVLPFFCCVIGGDRSFYDVLRNAEMETFLYELWCDESFDISLKIFTQ